MSDSGAKAICSKNGTITSPGVASIPVSISIDFSPRSRYCANGRGPKTLSIRSIPGATSTTVHLAVRTSRSRRRSNVCCVWLRRSSQEATPVASELIRSSSRESANGPGIGAGCRTVPCAIAPRRFRISFLSATPAPGCASKTINGNARSYAAAAASTIAPLIGRDDLHQHLDHGKSGHSARRTRIQLVQQGNPAKSSENLIPRFQSVQRIHLDRSWRVFQLADRSWR